MIWKDQNHKGEKATRFILKGPRGGGKSKMLGAIGFAKWFLQGRSIVDMGGSLEQAKGVYNYFSSHCFSHDAIITHLPKEPLMQLTKSDQGNYFKAVAASPKQVRGPHPDVLLIDEACETKDELILSAMPMIDSSENQCLVMTSTFHKIYGLFQETWDKADQLGYVRISWDIFDVCKPFDPIIFDDPRLNEEIEDLALLKERTRGRSGDPEGWVKFENILQAWREKSSLDWFDVEYMGLRPSAAGMVNDPEDVDACVVANLKGLEWKPGAQVSAGLDWGFAGMTAFVELMAHKDGIVVDLHTKTYTQTRSAIIIKDIVAEVLAKRIRFIYADSSHPFENKDLQDALNKALKHSDFRCIVVEVKFGVEKEEMLGNYRAHFQNRLLRIQKVHTEAVWQHKRYRYQDGSDSPVKKDDHIPDATMLALKPWTKTVSSGGIPKGNVRERDKTKTRGLVEADDRRKIREEVDDYDTMTGGLLDEQF